jgi:hypothetical protein
MTAPRHTPGPWQAVFESGSFGSYAVISGDRTPTANGREQAVAEIASSVADEFTTEDRANAHLIAAAPDLLAALKDNEIVGMGEFLRLVRDFTEPFRGVPDMTAEQLHRRSLQALKTYEEARTAMKAAVAKAEGRS